MPKTKGQGIVFGLIMSYAMAMGMEVYNIAIKMGFSLNIGGLSSMTNAVFPAALVEASYMDCSCSCSPISGATGPGRPSRQSIRIRKRTIRIFVCSCGRRGRWRSCVQP